MALNNLKELFINHTKDLYNAEVQLTRVLINLHENTTDKGLREVIQEASDLNSKNKRRLEDIASRMDFAPEGKKCLAMEGLLKEAKDFLTEEAADDVRDAGLIADAQRILHYFIAGYGTISRWAQQMELNENIRELCRECVINTENQDRKFTDTAERNVNQKAMH